MPPLAAVVAPLVPAVELAAAVMLVVPATARAGAFAALAMLGLFSAAIARSLRAGDEVDCHCFGGIDSRPIGISSLIRNAVLATVAALVAFPSGGDAGPSVTTALGDATAVDRLTIALVLVVLVSVAAVVSLLRSHGRLLARVDELTDQVARGGGVAGRPSHGLLPGQAAPDATLALSTGNTIELFDLLDGERATLLVFVSIGCVACEDLLPTLGRWEEETATTSRSSSSEPASPTRSPG